MLNLTRYLVYLKATDLTAEEFLLLYTVYNRTEFPDNVKMLELSNYYYARFQFYDREEQSTSISWEKMLARLIKTGFITAYPKYIVKQGNDYFLNLTKLSVTDKFKTTLFTTDKDGWWKDFIEVYGTYFMIGDSRVSTLMSNQGETLDDIKNKFWALCQNGNVNFCFQVLENTRAYVKAFGNNRKITNYLNDYEACMLTLDEFRRNKKALDSKWTQDMD